MNINKMENLRIMKAKVNGKVAEINESLEKK